MIKKILIILLSIFIYGCESNNPDNINNLYKTYEVLKIESGIMINVETNKPVAKIVDNQAYVIVQIKNTPQVIKKNDHIIFDGYFVSNIEMTNLILNQSIKNFIVVKEKYIVEFDGYLLDSKLVIVNNDKSIKLKKGK